MTANAMQGYREKALEAGMDDYVSKPVRTEELEEVLKRWVSPERDLSEEAEQEATVSEMGDDPIGEDSEADPLDRSVLVGLRQLQNEDEPDILSELIELFLADIPPKLVVLREAAEAGDARSVERIAHTMKGSCGNMGAVEMEALCKELEEMGRSEDLTSAPARISMLEGAFGRVRAALVKELARF